MGLQSEGPGSKSEKHADVAKLQQSHPQTRLTRACVHENREARMTGNDSPPAWYDGWRRGRLKGFQQAYLWFWGQREHDPNSCLRIAYWYVRTILGVPGYHNAQDIAHQSFHKAFEEMSRDVVSGRFSWRSEDKTRAYFLEKLKSRCKDCLRSPIYRPHGDPPDEDTPVEDQAFVSALISTLVERLREEGRQADAETLEVIGDCACNHNHSERKQMSECCMQKLGISRHAWDQRVRRLREYLREVLLECPDDPREHLLKYLDEQPIENQGGEDNDDQNDL